MMFLFSRGLWSPTQRACGRLHEGYAVAYTHGMRLPTRRVCGCLHTGYVVAYT